MSEKKKWNLRDVLVHFFTVAFALVFLFSAYQIIDYFAEDHAQDQLKEEMILESVTPATYELHYEQQTSEPITTQSGQNSEMPQQPKTILLEPDISVEFSKLKNKYPQIVGWLYLPETQLNDPVMQGKDNQFYVDHLPDGKENRSGSLFVDFRDRGDLAGWKSVIYGHNMKNGTKFGTLLRYRSADYYREHPYLFYLTENAVFRLEIFSGIYISMNSSFYDTIESLEEKNALLNETRSKSVFSSEIQVSDSDSIVMLSTCTAGEERFVLFAKVVPLDL